MLLWLSIIFLAFLILLMIACSRCLSLSALESLSLTLALSPAFSSISLWCYLLRFVIICFVLFRSSLLLAYNSSLLLYSSSQYILSCCWFYIKTKIHGFVHDWKLNIFAKLPKEQHNLRGLQFLWLILLNVLSFHMKRLVWWLIGLLRPARRFSDSPWEYFADLKYLSLNGFFS